MDSARTPIWSTTLISSSAFVSPSLISAWIALVRSSFSVVVFLIPTARSRISSASVAPSCERVAILFAALSISWDIALISSEEAAVSSMPAASSSVVAETFSISSSNAWILSSISCTILVISVAWLLTSPISPLISFLMDSKDAASFPKSSRRFNSAVPIACEKSPCSMTPMELIHFFSGLMMLIMIIISNKTTIIPSINVEIINSVILPVT